MSYTDFLWSDIFLSLLLSIVHMLSAHLLCRHYFMPSKARERILSPLLFVTLSALNIFSLSGILPFSIETLCQALILLWIIMIFQGEAMPKLLAAVIAITATMLAYNFISSFLMCLELVFLHTVCHEQAPLISPVSELAISLICSVCIILSVRFFSVHIKTLFENHISRWYALMIFPLLCIVMLWNAYSIGASRGILFRGADDQNLYVNQLFSYLWICVLSMLCMCGTGFYLFGMVKIDLEQKKKEMYRSHVMFYQMLSEQYTVQERLRHDMKNHIIALRQLTDCHEWDQLKAYLCKMAESGGLEYPEDVTGSHVIDALLYNKHKKALQAHIHWECDVHIPPSCPIDDFDLCVIFGNIIDNALQACAKIACSETNNSPDNSPEKFIRINCHLIRRFLLIEVVNSTVNNLKSKESSSIPLKKIQETKAITMRRNSSQKGKGIGLMNVQETVRKYNGTLTIDVKDPTYRISILFPLPNTAQPVN